MSDLFHRDCPGRVVLDHVGSRWGALILTALHAGPLRFSALRTKVEGISEKMLSQTLRVMVRDGLVDRHVAHTAPPQVTYNLTRTGHGVAEHLHQLFAWIQANIDEVLESQNRFDDTADR
jgi:DNA-binding HxlR family transcriptional regulator